MRRRCGREPLGHRALAREVGRGVDTLGHPHPERAVARQVARAGEYQVAHPGEPEEGERIGPERRAEPSHLGEPAGDQRGARVHAKTQAIAGPRSDRHDVLDCAAHLHADGIRARVGPQRERVDDILHLAGGDHSL